MKGELGATVHVNVILNRPTVRSFVIRRAQTPLVPDSVTQAEPPVQEELEWWPVHIGHHDGDDQHTNVVEPQSVEIRIQAGEDLVPEGYWRVSTIPRSEEINKAVVEEVDPENADHDENCLLGLGEKAYF